MADQLPTRFGIITKPDEPRAIEVASRIAQWAEERGIILLVSDRIKQPPQGASVASLREISETSDALIVLGGDGTMIATSVLVGGRGTPVLGVNLGTLGYLTEFTVEEVVPALEDVLKGDYEVSKRMMLDWKVIRNDDLIGESSALNDVIVTKSTTARIIEIECRVGSNYVTTYRADGLIVSTPTGSTAYNLSAGGPIIVPDAQAIAICPICPHTLTNRPLVLPHSDAIRLCLKTREQEVILTADGRISLHLMAGDCIEIMKSEKTFNTIRAKDRDYFDILRKKLRWGGR